MLVQLLIFGPAGWGVARDSPRRQRCSDPAGQVAGRRLPSAPLGQNRTGSAEEGGVPFRTLAGYASTCRRVVTSRHRLTPRVKVEVGSPGLARRQPGNSCFRTPLWQRVAAERSPYSKACWVGSGTMEFRRTAAGKLAAPTADLPG